LGNILASFPKSAWHLLKGTSPKSAWHLLVVTSVDPQVVGTFDGLGYTGRMPQRPLVRAKQKVRQTRRLAQWRAKKAAQEAQNAPKETPKAAS
jgi:hypothetical protein